LKENLLKQSYKKRGEKRGRPGCCCLNLEKREKKGRAPFRRLPNVCLKRERQGEHSAAGKLKNSECSLKRVRVIQKKKKGKKGEKNQKRCFLGGLSKVKEREEKGSERKVGQKKH